MQNGKERSSLHGLIFRLVRLMQLNLSLGEMLRLEPAPKLDDGLCIPPEPFDIIPALGLPGQVIQHKLIEIIHQIPRQFLLALQILLNLIEIAIQHPDGVPLSHILQALAVPLDNPSKTLPLIAHLLRLAPVYNFCLLFYKICYIFLIIEDLSTAILV